MTDHEPTEGMDPSATFRLDQEAAEQEAATRDEMGWILHVRDADAQIAMKEAAAANEKAKASLREAVTLAIYVALLVALIVATGLAVQAIAGWVR